MQLWERRPPDTTDHVEVLTHVRSCACLPFLPPLGPEVKATYARLRDLCCSLPAQLQPASEARTSEREVQAEGFH